MAQHQTAVGKVKSAAIVCAACEDYGRRGGASLRLSRGALTTRRVQFFLSRQSEKVNFEKLIEVCAVLAACAPPPANICRGQFRLHRFITGCSQVRFLRPPAAKVVYLLNKTLQLWQMNTRHTHAHTTRSCTHKPREHTPGRQTGALREPRTGCTPSCRRSS